jgi:Mg/Co/Ni transporter MgtE
MPQLQREATAPTETTEARERRTFYVGATLDGYVKVLARSRQEAREAVERMDISAIAAGLDIAYLDETPKLLAELPEHEQKQLRKEGAVT